MKMNIGGIIPLSTNEWKGHISTVIFFNGCPFRCSYCHNYELIEQTSYIDEWDVYDEISKQTPFIDSVIVSGGEPTMQPEALENVLSFSKFMDLQTAIETNGYYPNVIEHLSIKHLIDLVFIDVKTTEKDYNILTGKNDAYEKLMTTLTIDVPFYKRTTVFKDFEIPKNAENFQRGLLDLSWKKDLHEYSEKEFEQLKKTN